MLRTIFFDAAGTLIEPRIRVGESYARVARKHGVITTGAAVGAAFRKVFHESSGLAFGPGHPAPELRRMERSWWREIVLKSFAEIGSFDDFDSYFDELFAYFADPANWVADDGAVKLVDQLKQSGYQLGIVSNFDYRLYGIMEGLGLSRYFASTTISSEAGWAKPDPRIFTAALAQHKTAPNEALHVGDSAHLDVVGAHAAGIAAVLIDPEATVPVAINGQTTTIKSLPMVLEAVNQLSFA
ncbi:MAG TPA: HAD-IA family hydrolase [Candidatus Binataceae bacterium]|nr:HAD-IA family hydrolase [Candidatus Binataceae bacterium]